MPAAINILSSGPKSMLPRMIATTRVQTIALRMRGFVRTSGPGRSLCEGARHQISCSVTFSLRLDGDHTEEAVWQCGDMVVVEISGGDKIFVSSLCSPYTEGRGQNPVDMASYVHGAFPYLRTTCREARPQIVMWRDKAVFICLRSRAQGVQWVS